MMWDIGNEDRSRESGISMPTPSLDVPRTHHRPHSYGGPFQNGYPSSVPVPSPVPAMRRPSVDFIRQPTPSPYNLSSLSQSLPRSPPGHILSAPSSGYFLNSATHHHSSSHHHHKHRSKSHSRHRHSHSHSHSQVQPPVYYVQQPQQPQVVQYVQQPQRPLRPHSAQPVLIRPPSQQVIRPRPSQQQIVQHQHHRPQEYDQPQGFAYSTCRGHKKAVCIGINYIGEQHALRGCINDARNVRENLVANHGFPPSQILLLTDDTRHANNMPTRANMLSAMRWLVEGAHREDSLFFHYSGHGGQTPDRDGDETDGWDEVIFPLDFKQRGQIIDDEMHDIMVKSLPAGCRLTAVFDSCHSGTVLDLPYIYSSSGRLKGSHVSDRARRRKGTPADVISWSGCKDGQTSADTFADGVAVGAMSHAFMSSLRANPNQTYKELLRSIRQILYQKYSQKPQLGSSHHIDTNLRFVI